MDSMTAATPRRRCRTARLRLEQLEDRLVPALTAADEVPGQLLLRVKPGTDLPALYAEHGLTQLSSFDASVPGLKLVATPTAQARSTIPALQRDPRVLYAEPNVLLSPTQVPNDPT